MITSQHEKIKLI